MEIEEKACEGSIQISGPSLLHPSGTMGQGVYVRGELAKRLNLVTVEKSNPSQLRQGWCVSMRASHTCNT